MENKAMDITPSEPPPSYEEATKNQRDGPTPANLQNTDPYHPYPPYPPYPTQYPTQYPPAYPIHSQYPPPGANIQPSPGQTCVVDSQPPSQHKATQKKCVLVVVLSVMVVIFVIIVISIMY